MIGYRFIKKSLDQDERAFLCSIKKTHTHNKVCPLKKTRCLSAVAEQNVLFYASFLGKIAFVPLNNDIISQLLLGSFHSLLYNNGSKDIKTLMLLPVKICKTEVIFHKCIKMVLVLRLNSRNLLWTFSWYYLTFEYWTYSGDHNASFGQ